MADTANVIFVSAAFGFTVVLTVIFSIWFFFRMTNPKAKGRDRRWLSGLIIGMLFYMSYPLFFLAIDVLDTQICVGPKQILLDIGGIDSGCNIPVLATWQMLSFVVYFSGCCIMPYLNVLTWNQSRSRGVRIILAAAAGLSGMAVVIGFVLMVWGLPGFFDRFVSVEALLSTPVPACICGTSEPATCECNTITTNCTELPETGQYLDALAGIYEGFCRYDGASMGYEARVSTGIYDFWEALLKLFAYVGYIILYPILSVGLIYFPWSLFALFFRRPRAPLSKSEYIVEARRIYSRTKEIKRKLAVWVEAGRADLSLLERMQIRWNLHNLSRDLMHIELYAHRIDMMCPAGGDPELTWTLTLMGIWAKLIFGIVSSAASMLWVCNIALFLIPEQPIRFVMNDLVHFKDFSGSNSSASAYILNVLDLIFLIYMILHIAICATTGLIWFKTRINLFKGVACIPGFMTISGFLNVMWPMMLCSVSIVTFVAHNLRAAMEGTQIQNRIARSEGAFSSFRTEMELGSLTGIYLLICLCVSAVALPVIELCSPLTYDMKMGS